MRWDEYFRKRSNMFFYEYLPNILSLENYKLVFETFSNLDDLLHCCSILRSNI